VTVWTFWRRKIPLATTWIRTPDGCAVATPSAPPRQSCILQLFTVICNMTLKNVKGKVTGLPQQAEVSQGVPGRLRPQIFLTFLHYKGGRSSAKLTGRLYLRRNPWYSLSEAESTSWHMVLSGVPRKKSPVTPLGIDPVTVRLVAQCT